jgi:hypothetical protein
LATETAPSVLEFAGGLGAHTLVVQAVLFPLLSVALMLAGPLVLLPYRKFNDVLDGATFGAASAVAFTGAATIATSARFFDEGLRPVAQIWPWIPRLLAYGIAMPVLAGGAAGGVAGALWLRYRSAVRDRGALGALGLPPVALTLAAALVVAGAFAPLVVRPGPALGWLAGLDLIALIWLRQVIHVGLLQEAREADVGPPVVCANCGAVTPAHSFCANCGISLRALPKTAQRGQQATARPEGVS